MQDGFEEEGKKPSHSGKVVKLGSGESKHIPRALVGPGPSLGKRRSEATEYAGKLWIRLENQSSVRVIQMSGIPRTRNAEIVGDRSDVGAENATGGGLLAANKEPELVKD